MNQNNLFAILRDNRLTQTQQEVTDFEIALAEIADNPDEQNLSAYHLVLDVSMSTARSDVQLNLFSRIF